MPVNLKGRDNINKFTSRDDICSSNVNTKVFFPGRKGEEETKKYPGKSNKHFSIFIYYLALLSCKLYTTSKERE